MGCAKVLWSNIKRIGDELWGCSVTLKGYGDMLTLKLCGIGDVLKVLWSNIKRIGDG